MIAGLLNLQTETLPWSGGCQLLFLVPQVPSTHNYGYTQFLKQCMGVSLTETSLSADNAQGAWAPGPLQPQLAPGSVHVWRADLSRVDDELCALLSGDEHARAERILNKRDGELWRRSRGLLRALLGRYLQREPRSLRFVAGEHGKPELDQDRLAFNMSHSEELALYVFSRAGAVGVDVEVARRPVNEVALFTRMFGQAEAQRLQALDPDARRREFLRAWVRHEAELKCLGVGIGGTDAEQGAREPWIVDLDMGPRAAAAVAVESQPRDPVLFSV